MNDLKLIWATLGEGRISRPRNLSWTKKGPGRRHSKLPKKIVEAINKLRLEGHVIDPTTIAIA